EQPPHDNCQRANECANHPEEQRLGKDARDHKPHHAQQHRGGDAGPEPERFLGSRVVGLRDGHIRLYAPHNQKNAKIFRLNPKKALEIREEMLLNHLKIRGSQAQLRRRVTELLGDETLVTSENLAASVHEVDDLLTVEEGDRRHLFYEQMKEFFFAMREIKPEEVDDQTLEEILEASDQLMGAIHKIRLRRKQQAEREKAGKRFVV